MDSAHSRGGRQILRIGFVSICDASDATAWSGIPFQVLNQMRKQGADVEVLSPLKVNRKYALAPAKLLAKVRGRSVTLDHFSLVLRSYARQIESWLRKHPIDVVFSTSTIPITLLQCRQPIVVWTDAVFHSMPDYYSGAFASMTRGAIARGKAQEETALQNCTIAVYASNWAAERAKRLTDPKKIRVLPFGSSIPTRYVENDFAIPATEKEADNHRSCELLFVGVDWERKGGDIAVETARLLNEAGVITTLKVVGCSPNRDLPSFVDPVGFMNKNSANDMKLLVDLFREADFFILPTKAEAAGIVFGEASSFGLPCLTYATGGVPDYVRDGVNGFCFEPEAPATAFATKIQELLLNPEAYQAISERAFLEYKERLNWESSVNKLMRIFRESLEC